MARKKKFKASFTVELNQCDKDVAHKRLPEYGTPSITSHGHDFFEENGVLYEMKGFLFFSGTPDFIENMEIEEDHGLKEFCEWARHNYESRHRRYSDGVGLYDSQTMSWVRFPNGTWVVSDWHGMVTCKDGDLSNRPVQKKGRSGYQEWHGMNCARKWDIENGDIPKKIPSKDWKTYNRLTEEFGDAWRIARNEYKKELKKSGIAAKRNKVEADKDYAKRTDIRMKVAAQTSRLRDELEVYLKCINDESMTVSQVGDIYSELIKLAELNKKMKTIYGAKMAKE